MTLDQVLKYVQLIARNIGGVKPLTVEQFNIMIVKANLDLFNNKYGFTKKGFKPEVNQKAIDDLSVFKETSTLTFTTGYSDLPADYAHFISLNISGVKVDLLTEGEWFDILGDAILAPDSSHPVCRISGGGVYINPTSITSGDLLYYKYPTTPVYARSLSNGIFAYDGGSSAQLEWPETCHIDFIRYLLADLGLSVSQDQILQYVETKKNEEE